MDLPLRRKTPALIYFCVYGLVFKELTADLSSVIRNGRFLCLDGILQDR